ncbi:MAG: hypothetical protein RIM84_21810 [Alphaproteobacteria bacterium]
MPDPIAHVSIGRNGVQSAGANTAPSLSADGRYVAFVSAAGNHITIDNNATFDVFLRDVMTATTVRASLSFSGTDPNDVSGDPWVSGDGRFVAYDSPATNIDSRADAPSSDIFVFNRLSNLTSLQSIVAATGNSPDLDSTRPALSADGQVILFQTRAPNLYLPAEGATETDLDIVRIDLTAGTTTRLAKALNDAEPDADLMNPFVAGAGLVAGFESQASNLVANGPDNAAGPTQLYVVDSRDGATSLVSRGTDNMAGDGASTGASLSSDGRYVAFQSAATNLIDDDGNGFIDAFVLDRATGGIERVSVSSDGDEADGLAANSTSVSISGNGRWVAFASTAGNLVTADFNNASDVFVHDRRSDTTVLVSLSQSGSQANGDSTQPVISADGQYIAFVSTATNLIDGQVFSGQGEVYRAPNPLWQDPTASANLNGGGGDDAIDGDAGDDVLSGGGGDDLLVAGAGDDSVSGDAGADRAYGQDGADTLAGGDGNDLLFGNLGNDSLRGEADADTLRGKGGEDRLEGGTGNDSGFGGGGFDTLTGGTGDDVLNGNSGNDLIDGEEGFDTLRGQGGDDVIMGGQADDILLGMQGADRLDGGLDNDQLTGGVGNDTSTGGAGVDVFIFAAGDGSDVVTDYADGTDKISLVGVANFAALTIVDGAAGAVITFEPTPTTQITLTGIAAAALDTTDFFFS